MAQKLITKAIERKLEKTPLYSTDGKKNAKSICKFFNPCGVGTWYVFEGNKMPDGDWLFFGIAIIHETELGYFRLSDLTNLKLPFGLKIERDIYHTPMTKDEIFNM
jgi:hypothetical protein